MTKSKQETPAKKERSYAWAYTLVTVIVGLACAMLLLGLAAAGLADHLKGMTDSGRTAGSIIGVSLMAFGVTSLVKLAKR